MSVKIALLAVLGAAVLAFSASAAASGPTAAIASTKCGVGTGEGDGYTYLYKLSVTGTTCSTGKTLVHHKGRLAGWHCSRKVIARSSDQYVANESCTSGSKRVAYQYSENT